ncbi:hypothetical protein EJ110_NYTH29435 [Nymphaea thermarum]|nr:hypothetical protein EJ110_NYTH29435 [Nymphaea thermarum]
MLLALNKQKGKGSVESVAGDDLKKFPSEQGQLRVSDDAYDQKLNEGGALAEKCSRRRQEATPGCRAFSGASANSGWGTSKANAGMLTVFLIDLNTVGIRSRCEDHVEVTLDIDADAEADAIGRTIFFRSVGSVSEDGGGRLEHIGSSNSLVSRGTSRFWQFSTDLMPDPAVCKVHTVAIVEIFSCIAWRWRESILAAPRSCERVPEDDRYRRWGGAWHSYNFTCRVLDEVAVERKLLVGGTFSLFIAAKMSSPSFPHCSLFATKGSIMSNPKDEFEYFRDYGRFIQLYGKCGVVMENFFNKTHHAACSRESRMCSGSGTETLIVARSEAGVICAVGSFCAVQSVPRIVIRGAHPSFRSANGFLPMDYRSSAQGFAVIGVLSSCSP